MFVGHVFWLLSCLPKNPSLLFHQAALAPPIHLEVPSVSPPLELLARSAPPPLFLVQSLNKLLLHQPFLDQRLSPQFLLHPPSLHLVLEDGPVLLRWLLM
jgi:hypothetical protein